MTKHAKLLLKILRGSSDTNIRFSELCTFLRNLGFDERLRGSHHIFARNDIEEIVNIQPQGKNAKAYQVKQIRQVILKYKLGEET